MTSFFRGSTKFLAKTEHNFYFRDERYRLKADKAFLDSLSFKFPQGLDFGTIGKKLKCRNKSLAALLILQTLLTLFVNHRTTKPVKMKLNPKFIYPCNNEVEKTDWFLLR